MSLFHFRLLIELCHVVKDNSGLSRVVLDVGAECNLSFKHNHTACTGTEYATEPTVCAEYCMNGPETLFTSSLFIYFNPKYLHTAL